MQPITLLKSKRLLLGVTGSIAAYKSVDLASKLTQAGAQVDVIMTEAARQFVTPLTFQAVTGQPVYTDMWQTEGGGSLPTHIAHVGLGEGADALIIAPATANTIARLATGLADDLLSVTALTVRAPIIIAPAMDGGMYENPAVQANLQLLQERGVLLIPPEKGRFASGLEGTGRLPETPTLIEHLRYILGQSGTLQGRKVIVTAGGTREALDPVRYITNRSSGKQGHALATAARDAGAHVILVSTTNNLPVPIGIHLERVDSAEEMLAAVQKHLTGTDVLVMAAAVADFKPAAVSEQKIKKSSSEDEGLILNLARTPDILMQVKQGKAKHGFPQVVVGFAAESQDLLNNAQRKLQKKGLDFIVANNITATDAGFATDTNRVTILDRDGGQQELELQSKAAISEQIISRISYLLDQNS